MHFPPKATGLHFYLSPQAFQMLAILNKPGICFFQSRVTYSFLLLFPKFIWAMQNSLSTLLNCWTKWHGGKILFIDLWEMLDLMTHLSQILCLNKTCLLCSQDVGLSSLPEGLYNDMVMYL